MTDPLPHALSSDELRAAARLAGVAPLPAFEPGWAAEELGVADAVAVRGLLARGLAEARDTADGPDVGLTPAARSALGPLLSPDAIVEVRRDAGPAGRHGHVLGVSADGVLLAAEGPPSVWTLRSVEAPATDVVLSVAGPLIPARAATANDRFVVSGDALDDAETLLAQDGAAHVPDVLRGGGLEAGPAAALAGVLTSMEALVTVRAVRRADGTPLTADALTWLDAGAAGLWTVAPADDDDATYAVTATDHESVHDALTDLLAGVLEEQPCLIP